MTPEQVIDIGREAIWIMVKIGAPSMVAALVVGVLISLVQALTQIQESTLSFLPKLGAMILIIVLTMPFTITVLGDFTRDLYQQIAGVGAS